MTDYNYEVIELPSSHKTVRVPVDKDGYVPEEALMKHFMTRGSPVNDYNKRADIVLPPHLTPRQAAAWWEDIDSYDIEGIDVIGKPKYNIGHRTGDNAKLHRNIAVYGTTAEEVAVRKEIDEAFPILERKKLAGDGLAVEVRPMPPGLSGTHLGKHIELDRDCGVCNPVVVHESSHHLRAVDKDRDNKITMTARALNVPYEGRSKNLETIMKEKTKTESCIEESCTVAEQLARQKPTKKVTGYYMKVPIFDNKTHKWRDPTREEAYIMAAQDSRLFKDNKEKPLSGNAAINSVNKNWQHSHIARLKLGKVMAINGMALVNPTIKPIAKKNEITRSVKKKEELKHTTAFKKSTNRVTITKKNVKQTTFASLNSTKGKTNTRTNKKR